MSRLVDIVFRADASAVLGSGHVVRCLTLADSLALRGERVGFICREASGDLIEAVLSHGFPVERLAAGIDAQEDAVQTRAAMELLAPDGAAWVVVDHYGLDAEWERAVRSIARRILVIDDLADRPHDCDLLLDQNLHTATVSYDALVATDAKRLLGPGFALLRPEFASAAAEPCGRSGVVRRLLVSFGGSDPTGETAKVLAALRDGPGLLETLVVVGPSAGSPEVVEALAASVPGVRVLTNVDRMAALMRDADFMIGSGGSTTWERCATCLPSAIVAVAENQVDPSWAVSATGATEYLGTSEEVSAESYATVLARALAGPAAVRAMAERAAALVDGRGTERVTDEMLAGRLADGCRLRQIGPGDLELVRVWRNSDRVRPFMFDRHEIGVEEHLAWFASSSRDRDARHLLFECADRALGVVNLTRIDRDAGTCDWGVYIGATDAPAGSGRRMGRLALEYASGELGLSEVRAEVAATNERSLTFHARMGFRQVGRRVRAAQHGAEEVVELVASLEDESVRRAEGDA